jgi:dTDP-glucose 4,6-dehydratase
MSTLLVIGGSGFFGKSILDLYSRGGLEKWDINHLVLAARNPEILKIDCSSLIKTNGVELLKLDISTCNYIPRADFVIHAAASTDASNYLLFPEKEKNNILAGTINFCRLAEKYLRDSKIVYVSSGAVYGQQPDGILHIEENMPLLPIESLPENKRHYAAAKRDAENIIKNLGVTGLNVSIARCFAFVGPWLPRDKHFAIGNFIDSVLKKKTITVNAKNLVIRSYMYADDLVEWLIEISKNSRYDCPIFNVGSENEISIQKLAELLALKFDLKLDMKPVCKDLNVDRYVPSIKKASKELGLKIDNEIFISLKKTIDEISKKQDFK